MLRLCRSTSHMTSASARAERHAHADFRHALARQICQHAINSDARKQQCQARRKIPNNSNRKRCRASESLASCSMVRTS